MNNTERLRAEKFLSKLLPYVTVNDHGALLASIHVQIKRYLITKNLDMLINMNEMDFIELLDNVYPGKYFAYMKVFLSYYPTGICPDLTNVWNLADRLYVKHKITEREKDDVFLALITMSAEGRCTLAPLPNDVY